MRKKLIRFAENALRENIIEPGKPLFDRIKGRWHDLYFKNDNPITLEIGCGRGEYAVGLARKHPERNFIGVDIKGERIWHGSGTAIQEELHNVAFLRIRAERLEQFFAEGEIGEIWLTFPGPRPKKTQANRRLTHPKFLDLYKRILSPDGRVHLKTDSDFLFDYTIEVLKDQKDVRDLVSTEDLYASDDFDAAKEIQTHYEKQFLEEGKVIKYIRFSF